MEITKYSATSVAVMKQPSVSTSRQVYERDFIENQIIAITAQRDQMIALKEAELKECQDILDEMDKLDVQTQEVLDERKRSHIGIVEIGGVRPVGDSGADPVEPANP